VTDAASAAGARADGRAVNKANAKIAHWMLALAARRAGV
jgi:hypothetical protein